MMENKSTARLLAERLNDWAQDYDVYGYNDAIDDCAAHVDDLTVQIAAGQTAGIIEYLEEAIAENDEYERIIIRAKKLLKDEDFIMKHIDPTKA